MAGNVKIGRYKIEGDGRWGLDQLVPQRLGTSVNMVNWCVPTQ